MGKYMFLLLFIWWKLVDIMEYLMLQKNLLLFSIKYLVQNLHSFRKK